MSLSRAILTLPREQQDEAILMIARKNLAGGYNKKQFEAFL